MSESKKLTDRATELASQAADAAGPMLEKAKSAAGDLADKAGPYVEKAAEKAGPYVEKAAGFAAQGVAVAAEQIDKATKGKYSDKITSVSAKIEHTLDRDKGPGAGPA
jgi:hypothetical protein